MPHGLLKDFKSNLPKFVALILGKLQAFIISYAMAEINKIIQKLINSCPPPAELARLTTTLNALKNVMGKYDKQVQKVEKIPQTLEPAIAAGTVIVEILAHMPIPSSVPPGIGVPLGIIQTQSNLLVFSRNMVQSLENDITAIGGMVESTKGIFDPVKARVQTIEALLARCAENPNLSDEERSSILAGAGAGLENDTDSRAGEQYTAESNGNTYTLSIVEEMQPGYNIPRRKAIAKDFRGIVVLQGPLSFAGDTQVLFDELKFRLEQLTSPEIPKNTTILSAPEVNIDFDADSVNDLLKGITDSIGANTKSIEDQQKAAQEEFEKNQPLILPKRYTKEKKKGKKKGIYVAFKLQDKDKATWDKVKPYLADGIISDVFKGKLKRVKHPNIIIQ